MKNLGIKLVLFINYFVFAALLNSVGLLIQKSQNVYGITESKASLLEPAKDLTIAIVAFLIGSFLPKLGYKKGMLISYALVFLGCFIMYFGNSFWSVILLFACTGFSFAIIKVSVLALIGVVAENESDHQSFMSYIESVFMLGIVFAYIIFPMFYSETNPNAWLDVYLILASLIAVVFVFILFSKFNLPAVETSKSTVDEFKDMIQLMSRPLLILFAVFAFMYVMTEQGIMSWLPTFNQKVLHLSEKLAGQMAVILMLSIAFGRFISGIIVKQIHWYFYLTFCLFCAAGLVIFVLPLASDLAVTEIKNISDVPMIGFVFPLIGLFLAPIYPLINSTILSATEKHWHSAVAGILTFFSAVGGTCGSVIIGYLFQNIGGHKAFYFSLIPLTVLIIVIFFINKIDKKSKLNEAKSVH
ncbi:MAG: MFS transporter [Weeksellaceae bacterium]|nr:MFS transporter [Weeksellaceae bacterium]